MMTTAGATVSKTLANALLSACTTSLPCSAACGATVGGGGDWATSGAAAKIDIVVGASTVKIDNPRIGSNLDSVQLATFNSVRLRRIRVCATHLTVPALTALWWVIAFSAQQNGYFCSRDRRRERVPFPRARLLVECSGRAVERLEMAAQEPGHLARPARATHRAERRGAGRRFAERP